MKGRPLQFFLHESKNSQESTDGQSQSQARSARRVARGERWQCLVRHCVRCTGCGTRTGDRHRFAHSAAEPRRHQPGVRDFGCGYQVQGAQQVEDLINNLPQVFAGQGGNYSNGASGTATVNLRGLGTSRTMVLINGRRMVAGSPRGPEAPDLNQIPAPLIERVEVLTGGASAVYGSDAVAGVVNFIMKDNFEGIQFDADHKFYNHNNTQRRRGYCRGLGLQGRAELRQRRQFDRTQFVDGLQLCGR
ncbi:MAG: TonB-dependent receptor plug domain-containing protein [Proteobacteria bacterium]|nr:TonB-dependent receptor plug domain-containing protein [Pseudomonadota bacterium]